MAFEVPVLAACFALCSFLPLTPYGLQVDLEELFETWPVQLHEHIAVSVAHMHM